MRGGTSLGVAFEVSGAHVIVILSLFASSLWIKKVSPQLACQDGSVLSA